MITVCDPIAQGLSALPRELSLSLSHDIVLATKTRCVKNKSCTDVCQRFGIASAANVWGGQSERWCWPTVWGRAWGAVWGRWATTVAGPMVGLGLRFAFVRVDLAAVPVRHGAGGTQARRTLTTTHAGTQARRTTTHAAVGVRNSNTNSNSYCY